MLTRTEAIERVQQDLLTLERCLPGTECNVYCWDSDEIRVAEISFSLQTDTGLAGSSYMQAEPSHFAMLFAVERYLVELTNPSADSFEIMDAFNAMTYVFEQEQVQP